MKKIILVVIMFMLFMGVVSASSINGDYKGNPIVKVTSNGKQLESDEVPGMIYDGHTVVPISLLRQIGASVNWNQDTYTVDVKLPAAVSSNTGYIDIKLIKNKVLQIDNFTISENTAEYMQSFVNTLSIYSNGALGNFSNRSTSVDLEDQFNAIQTTFDKNVSIFNDFTKMYTASNNSNLNEEISNLADAIQSLKFAKNNLIAWDNLRYSNAKSSQNHFDSFLKFNQQANDSINLVITDAHKEYLKVVNDLLSY